MLVRAAVVVVLVVLGSALTACGDQPVRGAGGGRVSVVASFYPLQWMAQQVGGRRVVVTSLTKAGAEPHDLELVPREVAEVVSADVVVYLSGFQPSVDDAIDEAAGSLVFDARRSADLRRAERSGGEGRNGDAEAGGIDPHFWLDPLRLAKVASAFADRLASIDPDHAAEYGRNARRLIDRLGDLDAAYRTGLADCVSRDLVTSHRAFGYLARRYGLRQRAVTGLGAEDEASPSALADVAKFAERHGVRRIYVETLVSPATARALARETNTTTAVLDPIEGLNDESDGANYLAVMRSNLTTLRHGQGCR